jgi:hypothetical protein
MEKIKSWWSDDGKWFCILVNDGVNQATVSLTRTEARELSAMVWEAPPDMDLCDCGKANNPDDSFWHSAACRSLDMNHKI